MGDAANFRRTAAGISLIAAPFARVATDVIRKAVESESDDTVIQLRAIGDEPGAWTRAALIWYGLLVLCMSDQAWERAAASVPAQALGNPSLR